MTSLTLIIAEFQVYRLSVYFPSRFPKKTKNLKIWSNYGQLNSHYRGISGVPLHIESYLYLLNLSLSLPLSLPPSLSL